MKGRFNGHYSGLSIGPENLDLIDVIGKGGQGQVSLCVDSVEERFYALKIISDKSIGDKENPL